MIEVRYDRDNRSISVSGHAGYAPKGQDIVCAGVSSLVYILVNGCKCRIEGETVFVSENTPVYDAVLMGLKKISENYPKNIRVVSFRQHKK